MAFYSVITDKINLGGIGNAASNFFTFLAILIILGIFAVIITYLIMIKMRYKYRVIDFEQHASGYPQPARRDTAQLIRKTTSGHELLWLRKAKVFRTADGKQVGKNTYWFIKGNAGYMHNFTPEKFEEAAKRMNIHLVDKDMRSWNEANRRLIEDLFKEKNWFKENIGLIVGIGAIIIVLVFMWLIFREYSGIISSANGAVKAAELVQTETARLLASMDNVCSSSGVAPA